MKQPVKKQLVTKKNAKRGDNGAKKTDKTIRNDLSKKAIKRKHHPQYGTSKLEEDFAHDFLDKLKLEYVYQFEAKDIGRFYDFYLPKSNILIEIDGDYWHGNREIYEEKDLKGFQKRAQRVDDYKNKWALLHGIPILRFWEHDIRKNPNKVMTELKNRLYIQEKDKEKGRKHKKIL